MIVLMTLLIAGASMAFAVSRSFAEHSPPILLTHFVGDAVRDSRTSSANGTFGRHERQDSAGMRLVTAALKLRRRIAFLKA
jgi:hypothetical protein